MICIMYVESRKRIWNGYHMKPLSNCIISARARAEHPTKVRACGGVLLVRDEGDEDGSNYVVRCESCGAVDYSVSLTVDVIEDVLSTYVAGLSRT